MRPEEITSLWLAELARCCERRDFGSFGDLFSSGVTWRDLLVFGWNFRNYVGAKDVRRVLEDAVARRDLNNIVRDDPILPIEQDASSSSVAGFFRFDTSIGTARGCVRLACEHDDAWRATAVVVQLDEIRGHEERTGDRRPIGRALGPLAGRASWPAQRAQEREFAGGSPTVLIIGGGQSGLMLAARLKALGVPHLLVERHARIGDNWRKRYPSLALHDPQSVDHLPYLPFPPTWPRFTPRDKFADFLEAYANLLDLNVWTGATVEQLAFDHEAGAWSIEIRRDDSTIRVLQPRHLAIATGANDRLNIPDVPGRDDFPGTVVHASNFQGAETWAGKRALVVGSGVTGHDIAQDLWEQGASVTLVQKSATYVVDATTFHGIAFGSYENDALTTADADLLGAMIPFGKLPGAVGKAFTDICAKTDGALHDRLRTQGFALDFGPDGTGITGIVYATGKHGYYYNVGASDLIADGKISVAQGVVVDRLTAKGVTLSDGREIPADLLVWATGYRPISESLKGLLGNIADHIDEPLRSDADHEMSSVWRPCDQDGLWLMHAFGIAQGRFFSKLTALQILAIELGLVRTRDECPSMTGTPDIAVPAG